MEGYSKVIALRRIRGRPSDAPPETRAITAALEFAWPWEVMNDPRRASFVVSPHQYHMRCEAGPMRSMLEACIDWESTDDLLADLNRVSSAGSLQRGSVLEFRWKGRYRGPEFGLGRFADLLDRADRGVMGIRTRRGLWCQVYEQGWPRTPPFLVEEAGETGLVVAAALSPEQFLALPLTRARVEAAIPAWAQAHVASFEWREQDDILPESPANPQCVLRRENMGRWL